MKIVKWLCLLLVVVCSGAHAQTPTITSNGATLVKPSTCPTGYSIGAVNNDGSVTCVAASGGGLADPGANGIPTRTALNVTAPATQTNVNSLGYVAGGGTAQAQTATLSPAVTSLTAGLSVCWKPTAANTATGPTLAVNGLTATTITKVPNNSALVAGDVAAGTVACAVYDGTQFELQNPQSINGNLFGMPSTIASYTCNGGVPGTQILANGVKCTFVYDDGRYVTDVSTVNTSSTITCPNGDCGFTAADVGKSAWVASSANASVCPISTISTVNSANSITLAAANDCTSAVTATGQLWWGHKDTTNLANAWSATGCGLLRLPTFSANPPSSNASGAFMLVDGGEFVTTPANTASSECSTPLSAPFSAPSVEGGIGNTFLIMTPDFSWPTCPTFTPMVICFGATAINVRGLFIRSTFFASAPGSQTAIFGNLGGRSESVNVAIPIAAGNMIGVELYGPQTHFSQGGGQGGSSFSCQADSGPVYTYASFCVGHHVSAGATWIDSASALSGGQIDGSFVGTGVALTASGTINSASKLTTSGAKMVCTGCSITSGGSGGAAGVWAFANNTTITLYGSTALQGGSGGNPIVVTGTNSVFQDGGGNALPTTGVVLVQGAGGNIQGIAGNSITGIGTGLCTSSSTIGLRVSGTSTAGTGIPSTCTNTTLLDAGMPVQGSNHTIYNLSCYSSATTVSVACTVLVNGSPVASTCTMTATTFCNDGTHQVALNNGDLVSVKIGTGASETGSNIKAVVVWN